MLQGKNLKGITCLFEFTWIPNCIIKGESAFTFYFRDFYNKKQDWENFKLGRNKTKGLIRNVQNAFFENFINENRDNSFL